MGLLDDLKKLLGVGRVPIEQLERASVQPDTLAVPIARAAVTPDQIDFAVYGNVVRAVKRGEPLILVSGAAGTGKSTLIRSLDTLVGKRHAVIAPTGVAALQAGGMTIHSFFGLRPTVQLPQQVKPTGDRRLLGALDLLVIDEISMVRCDVVDAIDRCLRAGTGRAEELFGGVQLLMVGDMFQLPPVVSTSESAELQKLGYKSEYFFSAHCLQQEALCPVELTRVFRQTDEEFVSKLHSMRVGEDEEEVVGWANEKLVRSMDDHSATVLTCTRKEADRRNQKKLDALPGQGRLFDGVFEGEFRYREDALPSPRQLRLKIGARVMFTKNDPGKRWVNGSVGYVKDFSDNCIVVEVDGGADRKSYSVQRVTWETFRYVYDPDQQRVVPQVVSRFTQFPLMLGWALTIHKCQGKTLEQATVDLDIPAFAPGLVYVALSRCRKMSDVSMTRPIRLGEIRSDPRIVRFYRQMIAAVESADGD